jgi:hypothetical protein
MAEDLRTLENRVFQLVKHRDERIAFHAACIESANQEFDAAIVPLQRRIRNLKMTEVSVAETVKRHRAQKQAHISVEDGFTQEEVDHYYQLLKR